MQTQTAFPALVIANIVGTLTAPDWCATVARCAVEAIDQHCPVSVSRIVMRDDIPDWDDIDD